MSAPEREQKRPADGKARRWKLDLIFAAVILLCAAALYLALHSGRGAGLVAVADFGGGYTETLPLDKDYDYLYDVGDYVVHLQVKDGAVVFMDSQCPDHVCEQFGWLKEEGAWAACVPAGVYVQVEKAG